MFVSGNFRLVWKAGAFSGKHLTMSHCFECFARVHQNKVVRLLMVSYLLLGWLAYSCWWVTPLQKAFVKLANIRLVRKDERSSLFLRRKICKKKFYIYNCWTKKCLQFLKPSHFVIKIYKNVSKECFQNKYKFIT